ncbi:MULTISPECIES: PepSY domain-containing protein [Pseudoalteromonas]|nr:MULTISPECIES: PepSY domain-containing protein [Pseudoalteromonas]
MLSKLRQFSRHVHLWLALMILVPCVIVIGSGLLLQVKKQFEWVQPATQKGQTGSPSIHFEQILHVAKSIPELEVSSWQQIDRLDVRPNKGVIKLVAANSWEAQIDAQSGAVLQIAYRRSDTIEAIHDGSWFAEWAKLWLFLPAAILLFFMWCSGSVLLYTTLKSKFKKRQLRRTREQ